jgi:hypothetical protein
VGFGKVPGNSETGLVFYDKPVLMPLSETKVHHTGACTRYNGGMKARRTSKRPAKASLRQSVTIPVRLAAEVRRVAKERHLTMSRALVSLAERGVEAEAAARADMRATYEKFMTESDPVRKGEAGKDLIRAIFGKDAIAEDPVR